MFAALASGGLLSGVVSLVVPATAGAQLPKAEGAEFQVNTYTVGHQRAPSVSSDDAGNFTMAWTSIHDGSGLGVFGQRFDSAGTPRGTEFQVNTYTVTYQYSPSVSSAGSGNFVVVWGTFVQDGFTGGVFGQRFDSAGAPLGTEFQVNTYTVDFQNNASVSSDDAGNFVVVWSSLNQDGTGHGPSSGAGVFGQRFDSGGTPLGTEFQVNTYTVEAQYFPSVSCNDAGNFVVVWRSFAQDGSRSGIFGQRFDSAGAALGTEFQVNTYTVADQRAPWVSNDDAGNFVVVWSSYLQDGFSTGVFGQRFDSAGVPVGTEFQASTYTVEFQYPGAVSSDEAGNFVVVWSSFGQDGYYSGVFGQRFDSAGVPVGTEFQANTYTVEAQYFGRVSSNEAGNFVVVWRSYRQDGSGNGIFGQRFSLIIDQLVPAKKLLIKNKDPDDESKNRVVLLAKDGTISSAAPGSSDDPRCGGDAPGTVKAQLSVSSVSSGESHTTDLPCQNWSLLGSPIHPKGYKYTDKELDDGTARKIIWKNGKVLKALLQGKGTTNLGYDLQFGVSQGTVAATLTSGTDRVCIVCPPFSGKDGSDAKKFLGRNCTAPPSCG